MGVTKLTTHPRKAGHTGNEKIIISDFFKVCIKDQPVGMSCDKAVPEAELSFAVVLVHVDAGYQQG